MKHLIILYLCLLYPFFESAAQQINAIQHSDTLTFYCEYQNDTSQTSQNDLDTIRYEYSAKFITQKNQSVLIYLEATDYFKDKLLGRSTGVIKLCVNQQLYECFDADEINHLIYDYKNGHNPVFENLTAYIFTCLVNCTLNDSMNQPVYKEISVFEEFDTQTTIPFVLVEIDTKTYNYTKTNTTTCTDSTELKAFRTPYMHKFEYRNTNSLNSAVYNSGTLLYNALIAGTYNISSGIINSTSDFGVYLWDNRYSPLAYEFDIYTRHVEKDLDHIIRDISRYHSQTPITTQLSDIGNSLTSWQNWESATNATILMIITRRPGKAIAKPKFRTKTITLADGSTANLRFYKLKNGLTGFGSSNNLRKYMKLTDKTMHAHHVIPYEMWDLPLVQKAATKGFHLNNPLNGRALKKFTKVEFPNGKHAYHKAYNDYVRFRIDNFTKRKASSITQVEAKHFLENKLIPELNGFINNAVDYHGTLNDYFKTIISFR